MRESNYKASNIGFLSQMATDLPKFLQKNPLNLNFPSDSDFLSAFFALAAPSLDGKTQSAFALKGVKVL